MEKKLNPILAMHLETGHRQTRRNLCRRLGLTWKQYKNQERDTLKKSTNRAARAAEEAHEVSASNPGNPWLKKAARFTATRLRCLLSVQGRLYG